MGFVLAGTSLSRLIELDEERIKARQRLECVRFIAALARRRADLPPPRIDARMSMDSGDKSPHSKRWRALIRSAAKTKTQGCEEQATLGSCRSRKSILKEVESVEAD